VITKLGAFGKSASVSDLDVRWSGGMEQELGRLARGLSRSCSLSNILPKPVNMLRRNTSFVDRHQQFSALQAMEHVLRGSEISSKPVSVSVSVDAFSKKMLSFSTQDPFFEADTLHLVGNPGGGKTFYQGRPALNVRALMLEMDSVSPPWFDSTLNVGRIFPNLAVLTVHGLNPAHVRILTDLLNKPSALRCLELRDVDESHVAVLCRLLDDASAPSVQSLVYLEREGLRGVSGLRDAMLDQQLLGLLAGCPRLKSIRLGGGFLPSRDFIDDLATLMTKREHLPALRMDGDYERQLRLLGA
jgi:hypothetical protein